MRNNLALYIFEVIRSFYMMLSDSSVMKGNEQYPLSAFPIS